MYVKKNKNLPGRLLTKKEVCSFQPNDQYYDESRWDMFYQEMVDELSKFRNIKTVLDMGPYKAPFIENSDTIDKTDYSDFFPLKVNNVYVHDCTKFPYPFDDKQYDLVIACQSLQLFGIFEEQKNTFKEIARISKKAIISLPYNWFRPLARENHMIDENVINDWQGEFKHIYEKKLNII